MIVCGTESIQFKVSTAFIIISFLNAFADSTSIPPAIPQDRLFADLFANYNPSSRPAAKGEVIDVSAYIEIQHFDFRENDGAFNIVGLMIAEWRDKRLIWNPKDYNNLTQVPISRKVIWIPDLEVYNNAPDNFLRMHRNGVIVLNCNGTLTWNDVIEVKINCNNDMRRWPHDQHKCYLTLGSWTYHGLDLNLSSNPNISFSYDDDHAKNTEYKITNYSVEYMSTIYQCCPEPYLKLEHLIVFERRSGYLLFYLPAYVVLLFTILSLAMKPNRSEKIIVNSISFILIVFQLLYFARNVGKFARRTPLIVVFYSCSLVIVTFTHLLGIFSLWTSRSQYRGHYLPLCLVELMNSNIARLILPKQRRRAQNDDPDSNTQFEEVKLSDSCSLIVQKVRTNEWIQFAVFLERLAIIVFSLAFALLASICFG